MLNRQTANSNVTKGEYLNHFTADVAGPLILTCVRPMNLLMFSDKKIMSPSDVTTVMKPPSDFRYQLSISLSTSVVSVAATQPEKWHKHESFRMCVRM